MDGSMLGGGGPQVRPLRKLSGRIGHGHGHGHASSNQAAHLHSQPHACLFVAAYESRGLGNTEAQRQRGFPGPSSARIHARSPPTGAHIETTVGAPPDLPMTPLQDATPKPPQYPVDLQVPMILPKQRASPASSLASLPYRRSNPSLQKLFESTASLSISRTSSGAATPTASAAPSGVFSPGSRQNGAGTPVRLPPGVTDEYRSLVQKAFVPHVAVLADAETEELIRGKGVEGGLLQLLRPFGESVPGKVTIRDSIGAGKSWEDFGVRFVGANDGLGLPPTAGRSSGLRISTESQRGGGRVSASSITPRRVGGDVAQIEQLVDRHLQHSEFNTHDPVPEYFDQAEEPAQSEPSSSPFYTLFLRRLLSGLPLVPHETFAHPVASVIAVSSSNPNPVEELRRLYAKQNDGDLRLPQWVDNQYLRYYVLVHDEETGEITKSNQTFDAMKRHFGLHCHLLRLKRQQCIPSDDDAVRLPTCEWMSASEELAEIQKRGTVFSTRPNTSDRTNRLSQKPQMI